MRFRIVRVDMDGFNGRDHHPQPDDVGRLVRPLTLQTLLADDDTGDPLIADGALTLAVSSIDDDDRFLAVWTCVDEEGRLLDLMDHEIEVARVVPHLAGADREYRAVRESARGGDPDEHEIDAARAQALVAETFAGLRQRLSEHPALAASVAVSHALGRPAYAGGRCSICGDDWPCAKAPHLTEGA